MQYIYEQEQQNYEDFASGRVLYNAQGTTSFPVRLASEVIQRCFGILRDRGQQPPYILYDPCCGGGYLLTVIGMLHGDQLRTILGSDISENVLAIARKNLSLLTEPGIEAREEQLQQLYQTYRKPSHLEALASVDKLKKRITLSNLEEVSCFQNDITSSSVLPGPDRSVNIMITDLPYGEIVDWTSDSPHPVQAMMDHAYDLLVPEGSVMAIVADKHQALKHDKYKRLQHFKIGKRQVGIFIPIH